MNDRFKFRVWNQKHNFYCNQLAEMCINYNGYCFDNGVSADYFEHDGFVIEQCTGFKDKNRNLIYEGDIVRCSDGNIYNICWSDSAMIMIAVNTTTKIGDAIYKLKCYDDLEIIGNIHEQAEQKD